MVLYKAGRLLQFLGLVLLPVAIAGDVAEKLNLKESLSVSAVGILIFSLGWLLQQTGRPR